MVASLFMNQYGPDAGYAIAEYERLFYRALCEVGGGDPSRVHFSYGRLDREPSEALPKGFDHALQCDLLRCSPQDQSAAAAYVARHEIELVVVLDQQPIHPLYRRLRRAGVRTIVSYWGAPISSPRPAWKVALKKLQLAASRSKCNGLIFESHAMADLAVDARGVPERSVFVVELGIDLDRLPASPSPGYVYTALDIPTDRRVILYSGHMEERKGVGVLINAAVELLERRGRKDVCFLICGNRGDEAVPFQRMIADRPAVEPWVRFAGYRDDLPLIRPGCYCGVIPSTGWDSFTYSSVEMAAAGRPVVASNLQGLSEAVLDQETGLLFEPRDAVALADCLEQLLDNPRYAEQLGRRGRERCERELNLEVQTRRIAAILQRLHSAS